MDALSEHNIPWGLVTASLQHDMPAEEKAQLEQWLAESAVNQETYDRLREIWELRLNDFPAYQSADEVAGWEALKQRLAPVSSVSMQQSPGRVVSFRRWAAAAAVLVLLASGIIWYMTAGNREQLYVTAANEQKEISLPDGSTIALKPFTEIHVAGDYNQRARSIQLVKGEAFFNVVHNASKPFTVNMDESSVKDLGTSFTIRRSADTVKVMVTSGKVAFVRNETQETRELSVGMSLGYAITSKNFTELSTPDSITITNNNLLNFDHTSLTEVARQLQKIFNKRIELAGDVIGDRKLKADLRGQPLDRVLQVVCASLNLDYTEKNGIIILKDKENK